MRPPETDDAAQLAELFAQAGEGIPVEVWASLADDGEAPLAVGEARARREVGGFSHRKAWVAEIAGGVVGMGFGYQLSPAPEGDFAGARPLPSNAAAWIELEKQATGAFFINGLVVYSEWRWRGIGRRLMEVAVDCAREEACDSLALTMFANNAPAADLYRKLGFREVARVSQLADPKYLSRGPLLLLQRPREETPSDR